MAQKIRLDLSQFKASGVYLVEIDASENILLSPQTIRLVVGFSKKGPFNAPVFCPDIKTARNVFGDIDTQLERKGSFFHRSLFTCLQVGPVFALNLLALVDDESSPDISDKVNYRAFSVDTAETNGDLTARLLSSFYNKERFWFPDPEYFLATVSDTGLIPDSGKLFDVVNLGKTPMSIIVRKAGVVKGYDIKAKEWYSDSSEDKPAYVNDFDYISDFFVDVIGVEGNWSDYAALSIDPIYSRFFNSNGIKKGMLDAFLSLPEIKVVTSVTGCIIPDFRDKNGVNQFIENIVNSTTAITGMFCAVNKAALDDLETNTSQIDLVGHHLIDALDAGQTELDFLSYNAPLINDLVYADVIPSYIAAPDVFDVYIAEEGTDIYVDYKAGNITDGDYIIVDSLGTKQYLKFFPLTDGFGDPYVEVRAYDDATFVSGSQEDVAAFGTTYDTAGNLVITDLNIVSLYGTYNEYFTVLEPDPELASIGANECLVSSSDAASISVGEYLVNSDEERLTRITKMARYDALGAVIKITCDEPLKFYANNRVQKFERIQDFCQEFDLTYLQGFTLKQSHMPNGTTDRMNEILSVMENTNIAKTLKSRNIIQFRYIVDTFNHGIEPNAKSKLALIAKGRQMCMALLNTPSFKEFLDSTEPRFTDAVSASNPKPVINTAYIATGGNLSLNPEFTYSLVDEENGSKYCGYFAPNLILRINGKNLSVPPAAHVSNLFVRKHLNGTPFAICAGSKRGLISDPNLVGTEYDFIEEDRINLEPIGINPIIKVKGQGVQVYANQTGFQRVNSALNNLHVRDILITIEEDIETILSHYLFEFNDPATRLEIKTRVDNYLEGVQSAGGLADFLVIMDTSNNTNEVIDQNIGIIDVIVEPARGIHKMINRVTIVRSGGVSSGGFTFS